MASVAKRKWAKSDGSTGVAWNVRYVDHSGARRSKTFEKKKDADAFCVEMKAETVKRGAGTFIASKTVQVVAQEFMRHQDQRLADGRITEGRWHDIEVVVRRSLVPILGKTRFDQLTHADVARWHHEMRKGRCSPLVAVKRVRELRLICQFGIKRGYLKEDPTTTVLEELRGLQAEPIRTFSQEQVGALLRAAEIKPAGAHRRSFEMVRCAVHLAAFCGLRWGEVFGLTVSRVDFANRIIEVRHSLTDRDVLKAPKTRSGVRDVPMPEHIAAMLSAWIQTHYRSNARELLFRQGARKGGDSLVTPPMFHRLWTSLLGRSGLLQEQDNLHFHALRHFAASWWIRNGLPVTDTASLMGHRKFDTTLRIYAHPIVGGKRRLEAFDTMSSHLLQGAHPVIEAVAA